MLIKAAIGAACGTLLGMLVWVAIGYFTGFELGIVAWAIGAAAGFGAMILVGQTDADSSCGVVAAVVAVLGVVGAKYAVVYVIVERDWAQMVAMQPAVTDADVKIEMADAVIAEQEAAGKTITWPEEPTASDEDGPAWPEGYPKDVVSEVDRKWEQLGAEAQGAKRAETQVAWNEAMRLFKPELRWQAFKGSFDAFDILWIILAVASAYKLGAGLGND